MMKTVDLAGDTNFGSSITQSTLMYRKLAKDVVASNTTSFSQSRNED